MSALCLACRTLVRRATMSSSSALQYGPTRPPVVSEEMNAVPWSVTEPSRASAPRAVWCRDSGGRLSRIEAMTASWAGWTANHFLVRRPLMPGRAGTIPNGSLAKDMGW